MAKVKDVLQALDDLTNGRCVKSPADWASGKNPWVVITAKNRRVNVLAYDALDRQTTEMMDRALIVRHKKIFIQMMQDELGVKVLSHLKDYDPELEISASVSIFEKNIEELLPELTLRRTD